MLNHLLIFDALLIVDDALDDWIHCSHKGTSIPASCIDRTARKSIHKHKHKHNHKHKHKHYKLSSASTKKSKGTQTHLVFASFALFFCSASRNNIYKCLFSHVSYICKVFTVICTASRKSWLLQPSFQVPLDILFVIWLFRPIFLSKCHDFYCQGQQPSNRCSLGENNYTNDHHGQRLVITYKKAQNSIHQHICNSSSGLL